MLAFRTIAARELKTDAVKHKKQGVQWKVAGRTVIVVDDGVATGATFRAALEALRRMHAEKVVAAIPVAPAESLAPITAQADEVECLATPENFYAVGQHYRAFDQTSDEEVVRLLAPFR